MSTIFEVVKQRAEAQEKSEFRRVGFSLPTKYARFISYLDVEARNNFLLDLIEKHLSASGVILNDSGIPVSVNQVSLPFDTISPEGVLGITKDLVVGKDVKK